MELAVKSPVEMIEVEGKKCVKHKVKVNPYCEVSINIPLEMDAVDFQGLNKMSKQFFNMSSVSQEVTETTTEDTENTDEIITLTPAVSKRIGFKSGKWSEAELELVKKLYLSGVPYSEMVKQLGRKEDGIKNRVFNMGLTKLKNRKKKHNYTAKPVISTQAGMGKTRAPMTRLSIELKKLIIAEYEATKTREERLEVAERYHMDIDNLQKSLWNWRLQIKNEGKN